MHTYSTLSVETIEVPHPDRLSLLIESQIDATLVKQTYLSFSIPFWKAGDLVCPMDGPLLKQKASIVSIDLLREEVTLQPCDPDLPVCTVLIASVWHVFAQGDAVRILVGMHRGFIGTILTSFKDQQTLL
jgi:transcription antitermination factor NusG